MKRYLILFKDLPVTAVFSKNGNGYVKRSTRTGVITRPAEYSGQWFYFRDRELVETIDVNAAA